MHIALATHFPSQGARKVVASYVRILI